MAKPHRNDEIDNTLELYVADLLHLIKIQPSTGASEAARAIRKRIKYGDSVEEQLRALNILELLILNSGSKIGPVIARDDKLLDVLKGIINGSGKTGVGLPYDAEVRKRATQLAVGWKAELADLDGYKYMASLWKNIPRKKHSKTHSRSHSANVDAPGDAFSGADIVRSPSPTSPAMQKDRDKSHRKSGPPPRPLSPKPAELDRSTKSARSGKSKGKRKSKRRGKNGVVYADEEYKIPQINYKVEAPKIRNTIAECHTHTTALGNLLISLPSGVSPLDDAKVGAEFNKCKSIRRKVLKYLQFVGAGDPEEKKPEVIQMDEEFLGSLIVANEQLVEVFKKYDFLAGYTDENPAPNYSEESSDESYYTEESSEEEEEDAPSVYDDEETELVAENVGTLRINDPGSSSVKSPPPRPSKPANLVSPHKTLQRTETNATTATASSDPFGDGNEVGHNKSVYD